MRLSIIIPHKNIPDLLQRCLDSIPCRDGIQVIIVDDNSDPNKVDFSSFPGLGQPNVEVYFTKEARGAGYSRNIGLNHALGDWVIFADADDYFMPSFEPCVLDALDQTKADVLFFNTALPKSSNYSLLFEEARKGNMYKLRYNHFSPWGKAIRKSLIDKYHIRFQEVQYGNDSWFAQMCGYYADSIDVVFDECYCWSDRPDSLSRSKTVERVESYARNHILLYRFFRKRKDTYGMAVNSRLVKKWLVELYGMSKWAGLLSVLKYANEIFRIKFMPN